MAMSDKIQGKAEEIAGKMKDDKPMETKGKLRQAAAGATEKMEDMRDKTKHRL